MNKKLICILSILLSVFTSCKSDDNYVPLVIETNPDSVNVNQNTTVQISIFSNDSNIPANGSLELSLPENGTVELIDVNNTINDISDDVVLYSPNTNFTGEDTFQYTICESNNTNNCKTETVTATINSQSSVNYNLESFPYNTLSEYNFFQGNLKDLQPTFGVLPYKLNSALFSDYAKKKRFVWMPNNESATYISDDKPLDFPIGTILIKNFYYDNVLPNNETKILETRLMINKPEGWIFANYVWNEEQTEATFDLNGSFVDLQWDNQGEINTLQYRIPAGAECHTCHKVMETSLPIGPKPRNLNLNYNYENGLQNQLQKLVEFGYLENNLPSQVSKLPDYNDESEDLELRARAYLDINCAHCHSEETHCAYRPMRFDYSFTNNLENIGVCVDPDTYLGNGLLHIVEPGNSRDSVLHFRLRSTEVAYRMPLLGRTVNHIEGIALIEQWIDNLTITCN